MKPDKHTDKLIEIMEKLRDPETGCPWDIKQNINTIAPYIIEEAHEAVEAIESGNVEDICDELGDLLLQVVYCSQLAKENKWFEYGDVVYAITSKMIRRHPHVFADVKADNPQQVKENWERIKKLEKGGQGEKSVLDGVPVGLAALSVALKLQKKAAKVGFDWKEAKPIIGKVKEEIEELEVEMQNENIENIKEEVGDLLFSVVNLARHLGVDPEQALRGSNRKFRGRFEFIENELGEKIEKSDLKTMEKLWEKAKENKL